MILILLIIKVLLLICVTSAKLNLVLNNYNKSLATLNDTVNPLNNTVDYNNLITLGEEQENQNEEDEIEKPFSLFETTTTAIKPFSYWTFTMKTKQKPLKGEEDKWQQQHHQQQHNNQQQIHNNNYHQQHQHQHHPHYTTTLKFNNEHLNSNKFKTFTNDNVATDDKETIQELVTTTETMTLEATTAAITFNDNKHLKEFENDDEKNDEENNREDDAEKDDVEDDDGDNVNGEKKNVHVVDDVDNIKEYDDNLHEKHQTNLYNIPNSFSSNNAFVGKLPQFQQQQTQQQQKLYQLQQLRQQKQQLLLPQEYHHLSDYRLLFNPERYTKFYLHTISSLTANENGPTFRDEQVVNDNTPNDENDDDILVYDTITTADDNDDVSVYNYDVIMIRNLRNTRVLLNRDTIGAAFGVNARPVASTPGIRIEEIELYNGLSLRQSRFNPFNPCRILIHGWLGNSNAGFYNTLVPEYLKLQQGIYNIFTVDWGRGAIADYITASYRVKPVGKVLAKFIDFLHQESGIPFENIHLIGFSMGAQIAGIAGKHLLTGKLPVIYALDPALPLFKYIHIYERLNQNDADYVEVLHTSAGSYGYDQPLGHVDFYINYGTNQPGCYFNECSHFRAFQIFAQSIQNENITGRECSSDLWMDMIKYKRCLSEKEVELTMNVEGLNASMRSLRRGVYYVMTNSQPPYKVT